MKSIIVLLLIINSSLQEESIPGHCGEKPAIQPDGEELILPSGSNFSLTCSIKENAQNLTWFKQNIQDSYELLPTLHFFNGNCTVGEIYVFNASVHHTGYYVCQVIKALYSEDEERVQDSSGDEEHVHNSLDTQRTEDGLYFEKVYVYVSDEKRLLIPLSETDSTVIVNDVSLFRVEVTLPCRPTHPNIQVTLFRRQFGSSEEQQVYPSQNSQWEFDPRRGFLLNITDLSDGGDFRCVATHMGRNDERKFELVVAEDSGKLSILPDNEERIFPSGSSFSFMCLECGYRKTSLSWSYPNKEDEERYQVRHFEKHGCILAKLNVFNATVHDTGYFTCQKNDDMNAKIYVYVSDETTFFVPFMGKDTTDNFIDADEKIHICFFYFQMLSVCSAGFVWFSESIS